MPEGPSIVILKEQVQAFKGKKVVTVDGNSSQDIARIAGKKIVDFKSWGKHFLICFDKFTVRIHFMLFGTYRINETKESKPRLSLKFAKGEINFYACSVQFIEDDLDSVYDWTADVLSDSWDAAAALKKLKAEPDTMVCDAILDQRIFAGAGNIIKNEVLYRIKIHPETLLGALPKKMLTLLVNEVRTYSFLFLEWKKIYELKKHWEAHTKRICPRCDIPLNKKYCGKTNRRSYYCLNCQGLYRTASSK